jgi:hypothetical protein
LAIIASHALAAVVSGGTYSWTSNALAIVADLAVGTVVLGVAVWRSRVAA